MAPCFSYTAVHHSGFPGKDNLRQLRKPRVEKMRRDRINTCIEQLKFLLEKELHRQEPNAKLEKADVLEMTVSYLRRRLLLPAAAAAPGGPGEPSHREPSLQGFAQGHRDLLSSAGPSRETSVCAAPSPPPPPSLLVLQHQEHQRGLLLAQRDFTSTSSSSSIVSSTHRPTGSKSLVWRPW